MRVVSVAEIKDGLSEYLARAKKTSEPIVVTHHGKPYALIQPLEEADLEELEWKQLAKKKLAKAWEGLGRRRGCPLRLPIGTARSSWGTSPLHWSTGSRPRPALVVSVEAFHRKLLDGIICPISSQPRYYQKPGPGDQSAGLRM